MRKVAAIVVYVAICTLAGCLVLTAVDRDLIPSDDPSGRGGGAGAIGGNTSVAGSGGNVGGQGGTAGGTAGSGGNVGGQGGTAGGTAGSGGNVGGQGGTGGSAGGGGQGGQGGDPCTDIYITLDSFDPASNINDNSGPQTLVVYLVHGTSTGNKLTATLKLVNNLDNPPDFTVPQSTTVIDYVQLWCEDPVGSGYVMACQTTLTAGAGDCTPNPGCYDPGSGTFLMQLRVKPKVGETGPFRVGLHPDTPSGIFCGDQSALPIHTVVP